jgi:hypothetical protein
MWNSIRQKDNGHKRRAPTVHARVNDGRKKENGVGYIICKTDSLSANQPSILKDNMEYLTLSLLFPARTEPSFFVLTYILYLSVFTSPMNINSYLLETGTVQSNGRASTVVL